MGCGSGVFGLTVLMTLLRDKGQLIDIGLEFYDYEEGILSNTLYNLKQLNIDLISHVKEIKLIVSDMFNQIPSPKLG